MSEKIDRRSLIVKTGFMGLGMATAGVAAAETCLRTPAQTAGPYYPERGRVWEDADLTIRRGAAGVAKGEAIVVRGVVRDVNCQGVANVLVELWQADVNGKYNHTQDDRRVPLDVNFQYWGKQYTDAEGRFAFKTIFPGKYPGRTPHIHFRFVAPDGSSLITQLYFAELARQNAVDEIYADLQNRRVADRVTTALVLEDGIRHGTFDVTLSGSNATPMVD